MIDIHCHILPGLDDGPATLDESLEMCRIAHSDGIRTIVATPHFNPGLHHCTAAAVAEKAGDLRERLLAENIDLEVLTGADVALTPEVAEQLGRDPHLTINGKRTYFLAELPHAVVPPNWDRFLIGLIRQGIVPVLTHPERNGYFISRPGELADFVRAGGLVQITAMSLTGEGGEEARSCAAHLLRQGLAHIIATDAHSSRMRSPVLSSAVAVAERIIGRERALQMVEAIPKAVVEGKRIAVDTQPVTAEKRRTWFQRIARL